MTMSTLILTSSAKFLDFITEVYILAYGGCSRNQGYNSNAQEGRTGSMQGNPVMKKGTKTTEANKSLKTDANVAYAVL